MARRKMEKTAAKQSSYGNFLAATSNASKQPPLHFVDRLANIALAQDAKAFANLNTELGTHFALHLLARHGSSSHILEFWQSTKIWNFLKDIQTDFDTADGDGRTFLHYLMMKPGDERVSILLKEYFPFRKIDEQDRKGNTPLHLAAQYGNHSGIEFYLSLIHEEHVNSNNHFVIANNTGETPADLARINGNASIARKLYRREFIFTPFHEYLRGWFEKQKKLLSPTETLADYQQTIIARLEQLAKTITIAPSEIDDSILAIFRVLNINVINNNKGIEIQLDNIDLSRLDPTHRRKIYELTPIGQLEWMLRDNIVSSLLSFARGKIAERVDAMQRRYDNDFDAAKLYT